MKLSFTRKEVLLLKQYALKCQDFELAVKIRKQEKKCFKTNSTISKMAKQFYDGWVVKYSDNDLADMFKSYKGKIK